MNLSKYKIKRPGLAFIIIFLMAAILSNNGTVNGSLIMVDAVIGLFFYKSLSI